MGNSTETAEEDISTRMIREGQDKTKSEEQKHFPLEHISAILFLSRIGRDINFENLKSALESQKITYDPNEIHRIIGEYKERNNNDEIPILSTGGYEFTRIHQIKKDLMRIFLPQIKTELNLILDETQSTDRKKEDLEDLLKSIEELGGVTHVTSNGRTEIYLDANTNLSNLIGILEQKVKILSKLIGNIPEGLATIKTILETVKAEKSFYQIEKGINNRIKLSEDLNQFYSSIERYIGVTKEQLEDKKGKTREVACARAIFSFYLSEKHNFSYSEIGRLLYKNHATIMLGVRKMKKIFKKRKINPDLGNLDSFVTSSKGYYFKDYKRR